MFDETYSKNRTLWYGYFKDLKQTELIGNIRKTIQTDLQTSAGDIDATSWVFYREDLQKDALDEQIRSSIMVCFADGQYHVQYNMSDFEFVTQGMTISKWLKELKNNLDK